MNPVRLRDAFFAGTLNREDVEGLETRPHAVIGGLDVSFHPTARFRQVRFFPSHQVPERVRHLFARPVPGNSRIAAGFVDPRQLSLHDFENIIGLDDYFDARRLRAPSVEAFIPSPLGDVFTCSLRPDDFLRERLTRLDSLGLFVPPFNSTTRGGERFIFHAAGLAESLTRALSPLVPARFGRFISVNPVFRMNRFRPGDAKFDEHHDTPYVDAALGHVSRLTLLLYLSAGEGAPALSIEGLDVLSAVEPFTAVLFDQRYAHEGRPFLEGDKCFLRTELIFEAPAVESDERIAADFARATYLDLESVFDAELKQEAAKLYERVARAHWEGHAGEAPEGPLLVKRFRGTPFVTDGHAFWFHESVPLEEAAALGLLDVLNARIGARPFRECCVTESRPRGDGTWLGPALAELTRQHRVDAAVPELPLPVLFPPVEAPVTCCPTHAGARFDPTLSDEIIELQRRAQRFTRSRVEAAPVVLLGEEVFLNRLRFVREGDRLHVLSDARLKPINFAACWNGGGTHGLDEYLGVEMTAVALQPVVPPVLVGQEPGCWCLRFDLFRNGWAIREGRAELPLPVIRQLDEGTTARAEWLDAASRLPTKRGQGKPRPWWARHAWSALLDELYGEPLP